MKTRMGNLMLGAMLVSLAITGIGYGDLAAGLIAYYPFNGNALDESGNNNHGTLQGDAAVVWNAGGNGKPGGQVLSLDGGGDYVHVPDSPSLHLSTAGTIAAFINIDPTADLSHNNQVGIVNKTNGSTIPGQIEFDMTYNSYYRILDGVICDNSHADYVQYWGHDTRDGTWYHLAMTWGNSNISLYLDGTLVQTKSLTGSGVTAKGFDLSIGRHYHDIPGAWYYFPGMIDEVRIYNRALYPDEIRQLINSPPVADAGPDQIVEAASPDGAPVTLDGSASIDDGQLEPLTYTWTWAGGSATGVNPTVTLPLGTTTVTLTVFDGQLSHTDTVDVTVQDTTPPTITCPAPIVVEGDSPLGVLVERADIMTFLMSASASDDADAFPVIADNAPDVFAFGDTVVTFLATDSSDNQSSCQSTVTVQDTTPPTFICVPQDQTVQRNGNGNAADLSDWLASVVEATDICGDVTITNNFTGFSYECGNAGSATVTWTAKDAYNNTAITSATFTIEDPTVAVTYDGDMLLSTGGSPTVSASLIAKLRDNNAGNVPDIDGEQVTFTLTADGVGTLVIVSDTQNGVAQAVQALQPAIYMIEVSLGCSDCTASAILVVYNPDGGFATGGGWFVPEEADGLNTHPSVRANFGFNARYVKGKPTGHLEFRYSDGFIDLKSTSIDQLVITGGRIVQFKGLACVNGEADNSFFVKAIDNGEPGTSDSFEIKIWAPGVSPEGNPTDRAAGVLEGGNIVVHTK